MTSFLRPGSSGDMLISDGIRASAARSARKVAITEGARNLTYAKLTERISRVANLVKGLGLRHGERAAVLSANCLEYLEIVAGMADAGVAAVTIGPVASEAEIRFICEDAGVRAIFVSPGLEEIARAAAPSSLKHFIVIGPKYEAMLADASDGPCGVQVSEEDIFCVPYTSGATGRPKGVQLSHRGRILSAFAMAVEHQCFSSHDHAVATTPMFHGAGLLMTLTPVFFGGSVELLSSFHIDQMMQTITDSRASSVYMVPTHFAALFAMSEAERAKFDVRSLKTIISGTAPLSQVAKERITDYFGEGRLFERYGSTEASIVSCLRPEDQLRKIACVGRAFPLTHVAVLDEDGNPCKPGEVGEVAISSPLLFSGYLNMPEQTAASMRGDWFVSGDLATQDEEGYLYIVDRKNDMVITGGENVYPREVEEVLLAHPAVAECAVIGAPHPYWGEAVTAFVVVKDGMHTNEQDLTELVRGRLSRYKAPKAVHFVGALPRNSMGKVLRRELKAQLAEAQA